MAESKKTNQKEEELCDAIEEGEEQNAISLIDEFLKNDKLNINYATESGDTPILIATKNTDNTNVSYNILCKLLKHKDKLKLNLNVVDEVMSHHLCWKNTPKKKNRTQPCIFTKKKKKNKTNTPILKKKKKKKKQWHATPLQYACVNGDAKKTKALIDAGADLNIDEYFVIYFFFYYFFFGWTCDIFRGLFYFSFCLTFFLNVKSL